MNTVEKITHVSNLLSKRLNNEIKLVEVSEELMRKKGGCFIYYCNKSGEVIGLSFIHGKIKNIDFLEYFPYLEYLDLADCEIGELPLIFFNLKKLKYLCLNANPILNFPIQFKNFEELEVLDLSFVYNNLEEAIYLGFLRKLKALYIHFNDLTRIPNWVYELRNLEYLNIRCNEIKEIDGRILELKKLKELVADGNETITPPTIIVHSGIDSIRKYFSGIENGYFEDKYIKVILVGNPNSGKTTIFNQLTGTFSPSEFSGSTHGVQVGSFKHDDLIVYLWDFGGQDYYHGTHELFFTEKAIYLIVWEKKTDCHGEFSFIDRQMYNISETGTLQVFNPPIEKEIHAVSFPISHWYQSIKNFTENSPIVLVQNKIDMDSPKTNFPEISDESIMNLAISCRDNNFLNEIKSKILGIAKRFNTSKIPVSWQKLAEQINIESKTKKAIKFTFVKELYNKIELHNMCDLEEALDYLHTKGIIIWYKNNDILKEYVFLRPAEVCYDIYQIFLSKNVLVKEGEIILSLEEEKNLAPLIEVMKEFKIIFKKKAHTYIVPQYLPEKLSEDAAKLLKMQLKNSELVLLVKYEKFIPSNVLINFISSYGKFSDDIIWRNGICFAKEGFPSCIVQQINNATLEIWVSKEIDTSSLLKELVNTFSNLAKNAQMNISKDRVNFVDLKELQVKYHKGFREIESLQGNRLDIQDFSFLFGKKSKPKEIMHPKIKEAVDNLHIECLPKYFEYMLQVRMPLELKGELSKLRERYYNDSKYDCKFVLELEEFAKKVNEIMLPNNLANPENN